MYEAFMKLLNMSITASVIALVIITLRLTLRKIPKKYICILWALVALRLIFPINITSSFSAFNLLSDRTDKSGQPEYFEYYKNSDQQGMFFEISVLVNDNPIDDGVNAGANNEKVYIPVVTFVWFFGVILMLIYALVSWLKLKKDTKASICREDNIYICDDIGSAFILGIVRPRIYIPSGISEEARGYVLAHEKAHIKRLDYIWKPLGYALLSIYWFNPVMWVSYIILCKDIETACDEKVIAGMNKLSLAGYSEALLISATNRRMITACPVAFGETGVKERVKNVLNYKKPAFWVVCVAVAICLIAALCLLTNPRNHAFTINVSLPSGWDYNQSEEEFSPIRNKITITLNGDAEDTMIRLMPCEAKTETAYEPVILKAGVQTSFEVEKGAWFEIGVIKDSGAETDTVYSFTVKGVDVRIAAHSIEQNCSDEKAEENAENSKEKDISTEQKNTENADNTEHDAEEKENVEVKWDSFGFDCWPVAESYIFDEWSEDAPFWRFVAPKGTEVYAVKDGTAVGGYNYDDGNYVEISLDDAHNTIIKYSHLDERYIDTPQFVSAGTTIGTVGATGRATGPFLKVEISVNYKTATVSEPCTIQKNIKYGSKTGLITAEITEDCLHNGDVIELKLVDNEGNNIWINELGTPHMGWNSYYSYKGEDRDYLIEYYPCVSQGEVSYSFKLFYFDESGNETVTEELYAYSYEEIDSFNDAVRPYMEKAELLISTINGIIAIGI